MSAPRYSSPLVSQIVLWVLFGLLVLTSVFTVVAPMVRSDEAAQRNSTHR